MKKEGMVKGEEGMERITRSFWFFLIVFFLQFLPPYASQGYNPVETGAVVQMILRQAVVYSWESWYPLFKIIPIALIVVLLINAKKSSRIFSVYAGITYLLFAFLQSIAFTKEYGWGVVTSNLLMFLGVALFWFWEAAAGKNDFSPPGDCKFRRWWAIPLALFAFWGPIDLKSMAPDFNPLYFLTSGTGLAFCMMTPVYLAVLLFFYPRINMPLLRVTALAGLIIGVYNALINFFLLPEVLWWNGIIHLPLLIISIYALGLAYRKGHP